MSSGWWLCLGPLTALIVAIIRIVTFSPLQGDISIQCATSCGEVTSGRLPSCRGCDWYLRCKDDFGSQMQCPESQLFDVNKNTCRPANKATCGGDAKQQVLGTSSKFVAPKDSKTGVMKSFLQRVLAKLNVRKEAEKDRDD